MNNTTITSEDSERIINYAVGIVRDVVERKTVSALDLDIITETVLFARRLIQGKSI